MSVWVVSRAAAWGALWLLAGSALLGVAARMAAGSGSRWLGPLRSLHVSLATTGFVGALVHVSLLRYDPMMPFGWPALLLPWGAPYRPFWTGLGVLALYGWGLALASFDARVRVGSRPFRWLHGVGAPVAGALAALHAAGAGTDARLLGLRLAAGALLSVAVVYGVERLVARAKRRGAGAEPSSRGAWPEAGR